MLHKFVIEVEHKNRKVTTHPLELERDGDPAAGRVLLPGWDRLLAERAWEVLEAAGLGADNVRWWKLLLPRAGECDLLLLYWHCIPKRVYGMREDG